MGSGREGTSNIERPTLNIEVKRREEKRKTRTNPARHRLNPDLPVEEICWDFSPKALSLAEANGEIDKLRPRFRIIIR
jgi:hypothetical protein